MKIPKISLPDSTLNRTLMIIGALAGILGLVFFIWLIRGTTVTIVNNPDRTEPRSPLTGLLCANATRRPIAVMLASDPEARPLSGIGQADIVFEMPVTPNGITRMMAVYQCQEPDELGSIRSARADFIPLAQGLDATLAHWGGERDTLSALNGGVIDNIDALAYEGTTYYRKRGVPAPHNGFTTLWLLREKADELSYAASSSTETIPHHAATAPEHNIASLVDTIRVDWPQHMDVEFRYDQQRNEYARLRGGTPEIDADTDQQVRTSVVIVMNTTSIFLYDQYIGVRTTGQGSAIIYQDGKSISTLWKKTNASDMLTFTDSRGKAIPLAPGPIWVLIDAPLPATL